MKWVGFLINYLQVYDFIFSMCKRYHIDYSHNFHHSFQVFQLGDTIAKRDYCLTQNQHTVLFLSCVLHDLCDDKYTHTCQSTLDISNFLINKLQVPYYIHDSVMNIITSMSYSKIVQKDGKVVFPSWLDKEKQFHEVFHITRESDLLTSYDLKRMIHYKHERLGIHDPIAMKTDILHTVDTRMRLLINPLNLYISPTAKRIAKVWENELLGALPDLDEHRIRDIWHAPPLTSAEFQQKIHDAINPPPRP